MVSAQGIWSAYEKNASPPYLQGKKDPDMIQSSPSDRHHYMVVAHPCESSLNPVVREVLHFAHSHGHTPYEVQNPSRSEIINDGSREQRTGQHTNDEFERPAAIGCVDLGSVGTTAGLWICGLLLPSVEAGDIDP